MGIVVALLRSRSQRYLVLATAALLLLLLLLPAIAGGWALWLHLTGNIHEVEPGVYRSAQMSAPVLAAFIKEHHIRTVLNLRGTNTGSDWYDAEFDTVRKNGADLIDVKMSASRIPESDVMTALLRALSTAPTPLLIHCKDGADRSGLASALYELRVMHRAPGEADAQLSFRYGHFPWLTSRSGAMDQAFWRIAAKSN